MRSTPIARLWAAAVLAWPLVPHAVHAQSETSEHLQPGMRSLSAWVGGSWAKRFGPDYASIPTRPYMIVALRSEYVIESRGPIALAFFMEALPVIVVGDVPRYHSVEFWVPPTGPMHRAKIWDAPAPVYGAGLTPVGLQLYAAISKHARLFANSSGGVAWFTRDMPVPDSRQMNFMADLGGGIRFTRGEGALLLGLKFHHMSNANMGRQNPGVDGNVVYAGFSRRR